MTVSWLHNLDHHAVWLAWRNEMRGKKVTKVPHSPHGGAGKTDDSATWGTRAEAEKRAQQLDNGYGGGVGVLLGIGCGDDVLLGGLDLDTCRSPDGSIEEWALDVIARFASYTEISPSGTGIKIFFLYRAADLPALRQMMGTDHGRQFKRQGAGDHPPAIELYISHRYFAVTGEVLDDELTELRVVSMDDLAWLLTEAGPAFVGHDRGNGRDRSHGPRDPVAQRYCIPPRTGDAPRRQDFRGDVRSVGLQIPKRRNGCAKRGKPMTDGSCAAFGTARGTISTHLR
jgi:hypothetical protein